MEADHAASSGALIRARFVADPASVPGARRFVAEGLAAWGRTALVEDAALCVSELAGNAALHSESTYMEVSVHQVGPGVRLSVEDDGTIPASAVTPRADLPDVVASDPTVNLDELDELDLLLAEQPSTGRGLAIVSVLASDWGVEVLENGKRVWAELSPADDPGTTYDQEPVIPDPASSGEQEREVLPPGWTVVRLPGAPVEEGIAHDRHLDDLIRELQLLRIDRDNADAAALAERLEAILRIPPHARLVGRRQAEQAAARGEARIDVDLAMPASYQADVREVEAAVAEADELCARRRLLTLESPPALREYRAWMTEQILRQLENGEEPVPWDAWRSRRP